MNECVRIRITNENWKMLIRIQFYNICTGIGKVNIIDFAKNKKQQQEPRHTHKLIHKNIIKRK